MLRYCTLPTFHLLERFGASPTLQRFVYAGTSESYASTVTRFDWPVPTDESVPLSLDDVHNPRWSYAASKMHGEVLVIQAMRQFGRPFSVLRYHNAYGPRMGDKHVIPDFLLRAKQGVYSLYGHEDTRSFLYVDDTIEATIAVANSEAAAGQVVNIGSADELTMRALAERMMTLLGRSEPLVLHPSPAGSVKRRAPDVSRLRALTGFAPRWSLDDGLRATIRFYLGENAVRA